jgi:predicted nuclease of predicted toxin-antitoxin system
VRLLLDEMWSPTIALELRKRDFDVIAITEPAHASRYAGISDDEVFAHAQEDGRVVVTDNIADYDEVCTSWESQGQVHHGLIYALNPPFNRHWGEGVIGQMVNALAHFLASSDAAKEPFNRAHYLRAASD